MIEDRLGTWADLPFFTFDWPSLAAKIAEDPREILPPEPLRFAALETCQPDDTRVVILGQDPYPTPGHANGLAFSVTPETPLPKSLKNIFRELEDDTGYAPRTGDLSHWSQQGVLLLNTALTTPAHVKNGHAKLGWNNLIEQVLMRLDDRPRAFIFWGNPAKAHQKFLQNPNHLFVESAHPSPLSAHRGFFGSKPFSRVNGWLQQNGQAPIDWAATSSA